MDVITRLAALLIAVLLAIDAFSGERSETLRIDGHVRVPRWHREDGYRLRFAGGRVESCAVGWPAFNALADGDDVTVDTSRVFKACDGIHRGAEVFAEVRVRRWLLLLPMLALLAAALGWIQFERRRGDDARAWWFG